MYLNNIEFYTYKYHVNVLIFTIYKRNRTIKNRRLFFILVNIFLFQFGAYGSFFTPQQFHRRDLDNYKAERNSHKTYINFHITARRVFAWFTALSSLNFVLLEMRKIALYDLYKNLWFNAGDTSGISTSWWLSQRSN